MRRFTKYGLGAGGLLVLVTAVVLATGSGSAVAAKFTDVFVANDAAHPVPVQEQGTVATALQASTIDAFASHGCFGSTIDASTLVLSAIGGSAQVEFWAGGACNQFGVYEGGRQVFAIDVAANTTVSIPLSERLLANYEQHDCDGSGECTVSYALVGKAS